MDRKEAATAEAARVVELEESQAVPPKQRSVLGLAPIYAWADEPELAWQQIEQSFPHPLAYTLHNFRLDPVWDPLRKDSRFRKLLEPRNSKFRVRRSRCAGNERTGAVPSPLYWTTRRSPYFSAGHHFLCNVVPVLPLEESEHKSAS
jgi:hypothetical protein